MTSQSSTSNIARNAALNAAAQAIQLVAAIAVVPFLIKGLGPEAFGAFQLIWVVLGYMALVDFGLGRATTRFVADALGRGATGEIRSIVWSAAMLQTLLGLVAAGVLFSLAGVLARGILHVPAHLEQDVIASLHWMALALPAVLLTASFSGALEAHQRFDLVNAVRVPSGLATLLAPLLALSTGAGLVGVVLAAGLVRYLTAAAYAVTCLRALPGMRIGEPPSVRRVRALLGFGSWVTVSNVVSPLMVYLDRFVVGTRLGLQAVAHYTAPFDAITRATILPSSLAQALFPAFSALHAADEREAAWQIAARSARVLTAAMGVLATMTIVGAHAVLTLWLGREFADAGAMPLRILAVGVLANALAQVPFAVLQGAGRADITATFHLIELPLYAAALWLLTARYGITGTALAWSGRMTADSALLHLAARRPLGAPLPILRPLAVGAILPMAGATLVALSGISGIPALAATLVAGAVTAATAWSLVLTGEERAAALRLASRGTKIPAPMNTSGSP